MRIAIDISALQSSHRMRGIGFTIINFINNISGADRQKHQFIFYILPVENFGNPLEVLNLENLSYEVQLIRPPKYKQLNTAILPRRIKIILESSLRETKELRKRIFGDTSFSNLKKIDVFIQPDQSKSLPRKLGLKKVLFIYDIIPYVLEWEYLWSYKTARRRGFSRKASLRTQVRRDLYYHKLKLNIRRANLLLSISNHTKEDFVKHMHVKAKRIRVTPLGVAPSADNDSAANLKKYYKSSWGFLPKPLKLDPDVPFLLYVGGADRRRRIDELVTAFNHMRAQGINIKLIMSGDTMQGPDNIATEEIQGTLNRSSYLDDIIFMGFTDDDTRNWLYRHALAFVYPSKYEGFGLPVLEAMVNSCPVICYPNAAVNEVAGKAALYANNYAEIIGHIRTLLAADRKNLIKIKAAGLKQAQKYSWSKTSTEIISALKP